MRELEDTSCAGWNWLVFHGLTRVNPLTRVFGVTTRDWALERDGELLAMALCFVDSAFPQVTSPPVLFVDRLMTRPAGTMPWYDPAVMPSIGLMMMDSLVGQSVENGTASLATGLPPGSRRPSPAYRGASQLPPGWLPN